MRQLDPSRLFVALYWPHINEIHLGLVYPKRNRILVISYVASSLIIYFIVLSVASNYVLIPLLYAALGCIMVSVIVHKSRRYYELDHQGNLIRFYSEFPPLNIKEIAPVNRRKFLETVEQG